MLVIKPPTPLPSSYSSLYQVGNFPKVFLAGSIEMGAAENWQARMERELEDIKLGWIFNPRRDMFDNTLVQSIRTPAFKEQVDWELNAQEEADLILMYFAPDTKCPITLLELGLFARTGKLSICCPDGFWRKGNVEIICNRFSIPLFNTFDELVADARTHIQLLIQ